MNNVKAKEKIFEIKDSTVINQAKYRNREPKSSLFTTGFQTASGSKISIKKESIDLVEAKSLENDEFFEVITSPLDPNLLVSGFQTAKGRIITVKKDNLAVIKDKHDSDQIMQSEIATSDFWGAKDIVNLELPLKQNLESISEKSKIHFAIEFKMPKFNKKNVESNNKPTGIIVPPRMTPHDNRKSFKKPQLIDKTKLNKYFAEPTTETFSVTNTRLSVKTINNESVKSSSPMKFECSNTTSVSSNDSLSNDLKTVRLFESSENESNRVYYLKMNDLQVIKKDSCSQKNLCFYQVKPSFELLNLEFK